MKHIKVLGVLLLIFVLFIVATVAGANSGSNIVASSLSLDYGDINPGESVTRTITLTNKGLSPSFIGEVSWPTSPFTLVKEGTTCFNNLFLRPNTQCSIVVKFAPATPGRFSSTVSIGSINVSLNGTGRGTTPQPCVTFTPDSSSFPTSGGTGTITVTTTMQGCRWSAQSDASWITIITGAYGTGSGTINFSVSPNGGGSRTGYIEISGNRHEISQEGISYINYTEILPAVKSAFYTVPSINTQSKNNPPNYGRYAVFYKLTMKPSCSTYMELNIGGNPGGPYNTNTVLSHRDLGNETEWWKYYFRYFANDGVNPNNGVKHNEGVFTGANLPYYSEMRFNFTATYDAENVRMWNPKPGHVYYFMVVGENEEGTANYRFDWDCD